VPVSNFKKQSFLVLELNQFRAIELVYEFIDASSYGIKMFAWETVEYRKKQHDIYFKT
jgi:hypothetical protein